MSSEVGKATGGELRECLITLADEISGVMGNNAWSTRLRNIAALSPAIAPAGVDDAEVRDVLAVLDGWGLILRGSNEGTVITIRDVAALIRRLSGHAAPQEGAQVVEVCAEHGAWFAKGCADCAADIDDMTGAAPQDGAVCRNCGDSGTFHDPAAGPINCDLQHSPLVQAALDLDAFMLETGVAYGYVKEAVAVVAKALAAAPQDGEAKAEKDCRACQLLSAACGYHERNPPSQARPGASEGYARCGCGAVGADGVCPADQPVGDAVEAACNAYHKAQDHIGPSPHARHMRAAILAYEAAK